MAGRTEIDALNTYTYLIALVLSEGLTLPSALVAKYPPINADCPVLLEVLEHADALWKTRHGE
jgi:hypothetical protein